MGSSSPHPDSGSDGGSGLLLGFRFGKTVFWESEERCNLRWLLLRVYRVVGKWEMHFVLE